MKPEIIRIDLKGVNCYLIRLNEEFILVDTGGPMVMDKTFTNRQDSLERELQMAGCNDNNLKLIILTHGDIDHVANASFIRERYKTKIAMHSGDTQLVENPVIEKMMESFHYKSLIYKVVFKLLKKIIKKATQKSLDHFEKFKPDFYIDEGYSLSEYDFDAKILHIPGHTIGSIGILTADGRFIAGDTFANINEPDTTPNACDFKILDASIERLKGMNITTIYPGHGNPFEMKQLEK